MISLSRFGSIGSALENRNFLFYMAGAAPSHVGTWVQRVGVGWLTWELTESTTWLGVIAFCHLFPTIIVSPLAGVIADRFERLKIAQIIQAVCAVESALLAALTAAGLINIWILFAVILAYGFTTAFFHPIRQAMIPSLVRKQDLPSAVALSATMWHSSGFVGPALAGLILVASGPAMAFAFNATTYSFFIYALSRLRLAPEAVAERSEKGLAGDVIAGHRYSLTHRGIGPALILLLAVSVLARPVIELLPGFAEGVFERGAAGLAWMTSMAGLGSMCSGLWLARRGTLAGLSTIGILALGSCALMIAALAAAPFFPLAVACLMLIGFSITCVGTSTQTLIQSNTDRTMLGRVMGLYSMFQVGGLALGAVVIGALSSRVGLSAAVMTAAALCLLAFVWTFSRRHTMIESLESE